MNKITEYLHSIEIDSAEEIPTSLNYPHHYESHPIAKRAADQLLQYIKTRLETLHDFGLKNKNTGLGKMIGVLVVDTGIGELKYLAGFSGKLDCGNFAPGFVPPIFDTLNPVGFYREGEDEVSSINHEIQALEKSPTYLALLSEQQSLISHSQEEISNLNQVIKTNKANRAILREAHPQNQALLGKLDQQSSAEHFEIKDLRKKWKRVLEEHQNKVITFERQIIELKAFRNTKSAILQQKLFESYHFLNAQKEVKSLLSIFETTPSSGSGECAAPKLFQFAFTHGLKPIAMAEFWYGKSPNSEVRRHLQYYPACRSKCEPILKHMLSGLEVDVNPLLGENLQLPAQIPILYEDDEILVLHKPHNVLTVPGKQTDESIQSYIFRAYPAITGPGIVHRLDMSTSGILLVAKTKDAHKNLQHQFEERLIKKTYIAVLDGLIQESEGTINLPLRVDIDDRPRQMVCYDHGKEAITYYKVLKTFDNKTRIRFFPHTGRTHQLRVHAAHKLGLNTPIVGDDLYGAHAGRLHLHAEKITFNHPTTGKTINIKCKPDF